MPLSAFLKPHTDRQPHNKEKHVANIAANVAAKKPQSAADVAARQEMARVGGPIPAASVPQEPAAAAPPENAAARLGGFMRNTAAPALGAVGANAANAAMVVPRAFGHVAGNISAGFQGKPGTNEFELAPIKNPIQPLANQPAAAATQGPVLGPQPRGGSAGSAPSAPAPATTGWSADRVGGADAMLYGDQAKIVGGNSPQAAAALPAPAPSVRPTIDQSPGGWMRNEQTGEVLTVGANRGAKISAFDAAGNPIDKITPLRLGGQMRSDAARRAAGGNYSFEGSPEAEQRFRTAVSPGEYSPEAEAARALQAQQFDARQGRRKLSPVEEAIGRSLDEFGQDQRPGMVQAGLGAIAAKDSNEVAKLNATGQADERKVGLQVKQNDLAKQGRSAALRNEWAKATPERKADIEGELALIEGKQLKKESAEKVYFQPIYDEFGKKTGETPFTLDEATNEGREIRLGGAGAKAVALPPRIADRKVGEIYTTANGKFKWDGQGLIMVQ